MRGQPIKYILWFSVFFLAFETPFVTVAGQGLKFWQLFALGAGFFLLWHVWQKGFGLFKQSKILVFGLGFVLFSLLGLINSPQPEYSLKQILVLTALIILGIFFEVWGAKNPKIIYSALVAGFIVSAVTAIYQNVAFEFGWPHFEKMAARPNAFFPEADWLGLYLALGSIPFLVSLANSKDVRLPKVLKNKYLLYFLSLLTVTSLIITVARASWLALIAGMGIILLLTIYYLRLTTKNYSRQSSRLRKASDGQAVVSRQLLKTTFTFLSLIIISLVIINIFHLSRFDIPDRFRSIFFREHIITVAQNPATGESFKIDLEEIEKYRSQGYLIKENYIEDENVASRGERATSAWDIIKIHPVLGSGLGITLINTNFEHNANNLFLEWWASAGLGGLVLIVGLMAYLLIQGVALAKKGLPGAQFILAGTVGFIIVNLFNASIFLAFAWFYLALLLIVMKREA